jgi:hypothetical protein
LRARRAARQASTPEPVQRRHSYMVSEHEIVPREILERLGVPK